MAMGSAPPRPRPRRGRASTFVDRPWTEAIRPGALGRVEGVFEVAPCGVTLAGQVDPFAAGRSRISAGPPCSRVRQRSSISAGRTRSTSLCARNWAPHKAPGIGCPRWCSDPMTHGLAPRAWWWRYMARASRSRSVPQQPDISASGRGRGLNPSTSSRRGTPGSRNRVWRRTVASRRSSRRTYALRRRRCGPPAARTPSPGRGRGRGRTRARRGSRPRPGGSLRTGRDLLVVAGRVGHRGLCGHTAGGVRVGAGVARLRRPPHAGSTPAESVVRRKSSLDVGKRRESFRGPPNAPMCSQGTLRAVLARCESATLVGCGEAAPGAVALRGGRGTWSSATTGGKTRRPTMGTSRPETPGWVPGSCTAASSPTRRAAATGPRPRGRTRAATQATGRHRRALSSPPGAPKRSSVRRCGCRSYGSDASAGN